MSGQVPEMLWYLFWVALALAMVAWVWAMTILTYRGRMRALEILRIYAEKGEEPPPSVAEPLLRQLSEAGQARRASARAQRLSQLVSSLFIAGAAGAIAWWRLSATGRADLAFYLAVAIAVTCAAGSVGQLAAVILSPAE
jgi:hypothetical protein